MLKGLQVPVFEVLSFYPWMIPNSLVAVPHRPHAELGAGSLKDEAGRRWGCWCFRNLVKHQGCRQPVVNNGINTDVDIDKVPTWTGDFEHQQQLKASDKKQLQNVLCFDLWNQHCLRSARSQRPWSKNNTWYSRSVDSREVARMVLRFCCLLGSGFLLLWC